MTGASFSMADARILVVDDREANVRLLERMLETAGVTQVHTLTDPREAVKRCLELEPDLLLLDLHMPHLDGVAVLTALRAALPDGVFLPVIVLTADLSSDAKERALAAGAKDFLAKPLDRTEVLLRVGNLLETRALYALCSITTRVSRPSSMCNPPSNGASLPSTRGGEPVSSAPSTPMRSARCSSRS